jgi:hypothetical protein
MTRSIAAQLGPVASQRLERDADAVLARRGLFGPPAYVLSLLVFTFGTEFGARARALAITLTAVVAVSGAARFALGASVRGKNAFGTTRWQRAFLTLSVMMVGAYGLYVAAAVRVLGSGGATTLMTATSVALIVSVRSVAFVT